MSHRATAEGNRSGRREPFNCLLQMALPATASGLTTLDDSGKLHGHFMTAEGSYDVIAPHQTFNLLYELQGDPHPFRCPFALLFPLHPFPDFFRNGYPRHLVMEVFAV